MGKLQTFSRQKVKSDAGCHPVSFDIFVPFSSGFFYLRRMTFEKKSATRRGKHLLYSSFLGYGMQMCNSGQIMGNHLLTCGFIWLWFEQTLWPSHVFPHLRLNILMSLSWLIFFFIFFISTSCQGIKLTLWLWQNKSFTLLDKQQKLLGNMARKSFHRWITNFEKDTRNPLKITFIFSPLFYLYIIKWKE